MRHLWFGLVAAAFLGGCVSSGGGDTVKQIASNVSTSSYVDKIVLVSAPHNVSTTFPATFTEKVKSKLDRCATGKAPLRLEVMIIEFHQSNPAMTVLVGSSNLIKGTARLIDPATDAVVADYDVTRSVGAGGLLGAAIMADGESQMSDAFGDELCKRAFIRR